MLNKIFESKVLKEAVNNDIPKLKYQKAIELYLGSNIIVKETSPTSISFILDDKQIDIKSEVVLSYFLNGKRIIKDEFVLACLLTFKRNYIVNNNIKFNLKDFIVENNYYNNTYVTFFNIDEYKLRINFYIGVINYLHDLDMNEECLDYIVDFYNEIHSNITFDNRYGELKYFFKYQIIKNKQILITDNTDLLIDLISKKENSIQLLADIIYITGVNYPEILKNNKLMKIYDHVFNNSGKKGEISPIIKNLQIHKRILKWYNGEISDDFMKDYISKPEVRYCYIKYLAEKEMYNKICELIKNTTFNIMNQEINSLITEAFYKCEDYEGAVSIFNRFNSISYERYLSYKKKFPILFNEPYLDMIMTYIVENYEDDAVQEIIIGERLDKYQIYVLAKEDFGLLDKRFGDFLGKYDDLLIRIYQKEIIKLIDSLQGKYNYIPEPLLKKFEKMRRIKNGKYYIVESIYYILDNYYISYSKELKKYIGLLEV